MSLTIDQELLLSEIETLASFSDAEAPAVTRIVFTPTDLKARAWMKARCEEAGLAVRQDAVGNTFARWNGSDPDAPVVGTWIAHRRHSERREIRWGRGSARRLGSDPGVTAEWISSEAFD
jgi:hypothetical protein